MNGSGPRVGSAAPRGLAAPAAIGILLSLPLLVACEVPTLVFDSGQYDFRLVVSGPSGTALRTFHWGRGASIPIFVNQGEATGRPALSEALDVAAGVWTEAAVFGELRLEPTGNLDEAVAVLQWRDTEPILSTPLGCTGPGGGAASTKGCLNEARDSLQTWPRRDQGPSSVLFTVQVQPQPDMDQRLLDLIVSHEMGHVIGILAHSPSADDLMFGGFLTAVELTGADRQTLRTLYQSPVDLAY